MDISQILNLAKDPQIQQMLKSVMGGLSGGQGGQGGQGGGIQDLLGKLTGGGLQSQVDSWVGKGENQPVTAQQVESALGTDTLNKVAQDSGMSPQQAASDLAQTLPTVVDKATPSGSADDLGKVLAGLFR
ncbi:YidB family protein [Actinocorallia longicatena]|uniref:DUF937 domain-containing protein n=1 Tax=Actinocorallia longicatena TaxID=111803 RepID=A0ABP6QEC5_9ACTN